MHGKVPDGVVDVYEGGYAAFVLAKAERQRQAAATESRRQNLVRKELAWLRRGAPARTSKPKFRIDAANALIDDVPPPRDRMELQRFASQRLGKDVIDIEDVDLARGERVLLDHATWRIGPGDRIGIVGVNGAGKTSLLSLISGALPPDVGRVKHGRTVEMQHLTQALDEIDPAARGLPTVESIRRVTKTLDGIEAIRRRFQAEYENELAAARELGKRPVIPAMHGVWSPYVGGDDSKVPDVVTGVSRELLTEISDKMNSVPEGIHIHPKVDRLLQTRMAMGRGEKPLDWGCAETLAYGSLLLEGTSIRLSGQDTGRGTFSHRHAVIHRERQAGHIVDDADDFHPRRNIEKTSGASSAAIKASRSI